MQIPSIIVTNTLNSPGVRLLGHRSHTRTALAITHGVSVPERQASVNNPVCCCKHNSTSLATTLNANCSQYQTGPFTATRGVKVHKLRFEPANPSTRFTYGPSTIVRWEGCTSVTCPLGRGGVSSNCKAQNYKNNNLTEARCLSHNTQPAQCRAMRANKALITGNIWIVAAICQRGLGIHKRFLGGGRFNETFIFTKSNPKKKSLL